MDNELALKLRKELTYLGIILIGGIIIFQLLFFRENVITTARTVLSLYWLFILPGFAVMYYWHDKLDFLERLVIGSVLGIAVIGIASYYIGLAGLHVKYHFVIPLITIGISAFFVRKKKLLNVVVGN